MRLRHRLLGTAIIMAPFAAAAQAQTLPGDVNATSIPPRLGPAGKPAEMPSEAQVPASVQPNGSTSSVRPSTSLLRDLTILPRALPVRKQLPLAAIRATPLVKLGSASVNFAPVLQNPAALFNVASRLRDLPLLAKVEHDEADIVEIDEGLLVRSALKYTVQPGACANSSSRSQLEAAGNACFQPASGDQRLAALSNPQSAGFVADPHIRATIIANYRAAVLSDQTELFARAAEAKASINDPTKRAALVAKVGAAEFARISNLTPNQLVEDMVNAGEVEVEQVLFVPKVDSGDSFPRLTAFAPHAFDPALTQRLGAGRVETMLKVLSNPEVQQALEARNARNQPMTKDLGPYVFLTGFTLGKHYEWQTRVQYKVDPCRYIPFADSCKKTYYIEPYAKLGYGFGLRFPVEVTGHYSYPAYEGQTDKARVSLTYRPINGSRSHYLESGLDQDQLFEGKELVAEFEATAGFRYKVPFKQGDFKIGIAKDFTDGLPAPFANGQFRPPAPGSARIEAFKRTFTEFDLLGGQGNYGFAGVTVYPAIRVDLASTKLDVTLVDRSTEREFTIGRSGHARVVSVDAAGISKIAIGNPVYNLSFKVTPGIEANAFVDVAVWEKKWHWPVWFPEIGVELPPGGVEFACHAGTRCLRNEVVRAWRSSDTGTSVSP